MGKQRHKILIIEDKQKIAAALGGILKKNKIEFIWCEDGTAGLKELRNSDSLFALIICDQQMSGMSGIEFLGQAKKTNPMALRFLISSGLDDNVMTDAVNRGIIQKFLQKPWEIATLVAITKNSFVQFNHSIENRKLLKSARDKNKKLYGIDHNLNKILESHKAKIKEFDKQIASAKSKSEKNFSVDYFIKKFEQYGMLETAQFNSLFQTTLGELFKQFNDIAEKNGFEIPRID